MVVDFATETTNATQEAALDYAARGWPVFPLHSCDADGHCTCGDPKCRWPANNSAGKHPRIRGWREKATTKPETIRDWWRRWPSANVGIAVPPGMIVLDVDGAEGRENVEALPVTPSVSTGRGFHLYLKAPEGVAVRNGAGLRPGLDLRAAGGYVVAPPSIHGSGTVYEWSLHPDETPLADCPEWLAELLRDRERPARSSKRDATAEPQEERIPEGRRNATLTTFAGKLRDAGLRFDELTDTLLTANARRCDPPLEQGEVRAIARSVAGYPAGPVRVDRRIANADLKDGPRFLAMMLQAGVDDHDLAAVAGVTERTLGRWWKDLRDAELETIARTRPTRRYIELPRAMMTDETLSTAAKVTALAIGAYVKEDGVAQVGQDTLLTRRGMGSRDKLSGHVAALEQAGYLVASRALFCGAKGRRVRPNRYRWREEEMRPRDNEMAREAPAEAREAESMTERGRLRARGHEGDVTTEDHKETAVEGGRCRRRSPQEVPPRRDDDESYPSSTSGLGPEGGETSLPLPSTPADDPLAWYSWQGFVIPTRGPVLKIDAIKSARGALALEDAIRIAVTEGIEALPYYHEEARR